MSGLPPGQIEAVIKEMNLRLTIM